jgi:hypothetical protein
VPASDETVTSATVRLVAGVIGVVILGVVVFTDDDPNPYFVPAFVLAAAWLIWMAGRNWMRARRSAAARR